MGQLQWGGRGYTKSRQRVVLKCQCVRNKGIKRRGGQQFTSFVDIFKITCQSLGRTYTKSRITDSSSRSKVKVRSKIQVSKLNSVSTSAPVGMQSRTGLRLRLSGLARLLSKRNSFTNSVQLLLAEERGKFGCFSYNGDLAEEVPHTVPKFMSNWRSFL